MKRLGVSGAVRSLYGWLGVKGLIKSNLISIGEENGGAVR